MSCLRAAPHRGDSMVHKCVSTILKNKDGQSVIVSKRNGTKLIANDIQGTIKDNLEIWKRNKKNEFALCFKSGSETYVLNVESELTLVLIKDVKEHFKNEQGKTWFRKKNVGAGDSYCIRTASNPPKYLTVKEDNDNKVTVLSEPEGSKSIFHVNAPCGCLEGRCAGM